jgi:hypothetical protein
VITPQELQELNETARNEADQALKKGELASARQWETIAGATASLISLAVRIEKARAKNE